MGAMQRLLPMVRQEDPGVAQGPLLDAALDAFLDFGIRRTSMSEVARRSRLSPATLYRRFAQKSELVQAVGLREVRHFLAEVDEQVDPHAEAEEQVVQLFIACNDGIRRNRLLQRLLTTEPELVLPMLTVRGWPVVELGRDYLVEFIRRLQREEKLPAYDPEPVAEIVARVALSLVLTPRTAIPLADDAPTRTFVREHIVVMFGLPGQRRTS